MVPKKTIVICDDEPSVLEIAELVLGEDFEIITLSDNKDLLVVAQQRQPALIITDVLMPSLPLLEVIASLRAGKQTSAIPVLLMSASINLKTVANEVAASGLLAKPFDIADLRQIVVELVGSSSFT